MELPNLTQQPVLLIDLYFYEQTCILCYRGERRREMTIEEAINFMTDWVVHRRVFDHEKLDRAEKLGIEALRYIRYRDNCPGINTRLLLPGETAK